MIVIFLNELKNITISFIKTNYFIDISKANLDKNCNNIYSQAETGSFGLAKNSFGILLSNDIFNTKSYYFIILFVLILLFFKIFCDFIQITGNRDIYINNKQIISKYMIEILVYYPYIFLTIFTILIISMLVRRYTPNEKEGHEKYFKKHIIDIVWLLYVFIVINIAVYFLFIWSMSKNIDNHYFNDVIHNTSFLLLLNIYLYLIFNIINIIFTFKNEDTLDDNNKVINKDLSYYTLTNFYKKYFSIIDKDYTTSSESHYNFDGYIVKNIGSLLIYIFVIFIIFICIFFITPKVNEDDEYYNNNILMPLFIFLILIFYIFLFVVFNTDYNKYVIYGVYNSIYKTKLNKLNNIVIPYIKLHQLKATTDSVINNDFTEQYIITNIIASIINNTLCMTSYNDRENNSIKDNNTYKKITGIEYEEYKEYDKDDLSKTSSFDRKDYKNFNEYYEIVLKKRIGIEFLPTNNVFNYIRLMKNEEVNTDKPGENTWDYFKIGEAVNEIPNIHLVDTYINMYKYRYRFRILKIIKICISIFNDVNINNDNFMKLKKKYFYIGDKIQYKFLILIKSDAEYKSFIDAYEEIMKIIEDVNYKNPYKDIDLLKEKFKKDNFENILKKETSPDDFKEFNKELLKDEEFNNYAVYHYSKLLFNLTNEQRIEYKDDYKINLKYLYLKNNINNEDKDLYSIIDDFLIISSHLSYNLTQHEKISNNLVKDDEKERKLTLLNSRNKALFELILDNTEDEIMNKIDGNTFEYHISDDYYEETLEIHRIVIKVFTNIMSIKNEVNFTNNYLKQIVSMIYKQLNGDDINFNNNEEDKEFSLIKNIETNEDIDKNSKAEEILNKANNVVGINFLLIYLFNLLLLFLIFYIGKSKKNINFISIKNLLNTVGKYLINIRTTNDE